MTARKQRLSAHDALFLYWERDEQPFHVAECMIYKGRVTAAEVVTMLDQRMHLLPRYRQRVHFVPLGVGHPTWEDDPAFELSRHVVEAQLPKPSGDREISTFCGELFLQLIDREHPLWHMTVIHGHTSGNTIIFLKLHHAMVDGVSSVQLIEVLHGTQPSSEPPPQPASRWKPSKLPRKFDQLREAVADQTNTAIDLLRSITNLARPGGLEALASRADVMARTAVDVGKMMLKPAPATPFNKPITAARQIAWLELPLEEVHAVRKAHGATVNDLVLAILAGALARYMRRNAMDTDGVELRCLCPVSVRSADQDGTFGNQVSMVAAPLHVGLTDPLARLDAQKSSMRKLKESDQAQGFHEIFSTWKYMAPVVFQRIWSSWPKSYFPFNIVSTNVPGPREPLYLGKHELLHWYPVGVNWSTAGLFLCTLTYREYMTMGLVADPSIVTDLWQVTEDFRAAYEEIKAAVGKQRGAAGAVHAAERKGPILPKRSRSPAIESKIEAKAPKGPVKAAKRVAAARRRTRPNARATRPAS